MKPAGKIWEKTCKELSPFPLQYITGKHWNVTHDYQLSPLPLLQYITHTYTYWKVKCNELSPVPLFYQL